MTHLLHRMIDQAALARPESTAASCDGTELSYRDLARRANGLARVLLDRGLKKGELVAVLLGKGLDVPTSFYGVLSAGGALVPIDPRSPLQPVVEILRATGARQLVTENSRYEFVKKLLAACPDVATVVGLSDNVDDDDFNISWKTVTSRATDLQPDIEIDDLNPAYILHTSGSTGAPKLILHTHRSAMSFVEWAVREYSLRPEDRLTNHSSHHTCFATFDYYAAARAGAATVILTPAALMMPGSLSRVLEREKVSVWYSVPTALVHLSLRGGLGSRNLTSLRWVLFAGESFPEKHLRRLMQQLPGARFSHVYGSTEVNVCTFYHLPKTGASLNPLPIGMPCSTSTVLVVDDQFRPVPKGNVGELLVAGSTVMSGYWRDDQANRRALVRASSADGSEKTYFRTGDRVRLLEDGNLAFVARGDFQVKVRGHRVELEAVESALLAVRGIEEAAVIAAPDDEGGLALHAGIVGSDPPTRQELQAGLETILPPHAVPSEITVLASLPATPTGKIDRKALRRRLTEPEDNER